tara:strand:+ start:2437 stop:2724 length:288 start_codon:yes stop_codon:yes gene_type:complete
MKKLDSHIDISILEKAKILEMITNYLSKYTVLKTDCYACNIKDEILILGCTNSSSLNLIRNYRNDIIKDINIEFSGILKLKIKNIKFKIIQNPSF